MARTYDTDQAVATTMKMVERATARQMAGATVNEAYRAEVRAMVAGMGCDVAAATVVARAAVRVQAVMAADAVTGTDTDYRATVSAAYAEVMAA